MAAKETKGETHITIVGDNKKPLEKDFVADEKVMDQLFEVLLDRHPNFMPSVNEEESDEVKTKKQEKIPKAHVPTMKKNELLIFMLKCI